MEASGNLILRKSIKEWGIFSCARRKNKKRQLPGDKVVLFVNK
jgi:hypothetical protein